MFSEPLKIESGKLLGKVAHLFACQFNFSSGFPKIESKSNQLLIVIPWFDIVVAYRVSDSFGHL